MVKNGTGYTVSGSPGIAICYFSVFNTDGYDAAMAWYQSVTSRETSVTVNLTESIQSLRLKVIDSLGLNLEADSVKITDRVYLGTEQELAWIENEKLSVGEVLGFFSSIDSMCAFVMLNNSAGEVFHGLDDGIRYFIRPNERGHSAHVHVNYRNDFFASIYINDGEYRDGKLPSRVYKTAKERILSNRIKLLEYWNLNTNGIHFDINHLFANQQR